MYFKQEHSEGLSDRYIVVLMNHLKTNKRVLVWAILKTVDLRRKMHDKIEPNDDWFCVEYVRVFGDALGKDLWMLDGHVKGIAQRSKSLDDACFKYENIYALSRITDKIRNSPDAMSLLTSVMIAHLKNTGQLDSYMSSIILGNP